MLNAKVSLLFWNIHEHRPVENIVRLVQNYAVDILLLAESPFDQGGEDLLNAINAAPVLPNAQKYAAVVPGKNQRLLVYSNLSQAQWTLKTSHSRYAIWEARLPCNRRFLLAAAHFPELLYQQGDEQRECATALRLDLEQAEGDWEDPVSIVIGDLNASPFHAGIIGVYGLNATPSRRVAENMFRIYNGRKWGGQHSKRGVIRPSARPFPFLPDGRLIYV